MSLVTVGYINETHSLRLPICFCVRASVPSIFALQLQSHTAGLIVAQAGGK